MPIHRRLNAVAVLCAAAMMICALAAPAGAASSNGPPAGTDAGESFSIQSAVTVGGPWYAFAFEGVGSAGSACCSDVNYVDAGDPPWTFTTSEPAELKVADGYLKGDRFEIFDFGVSLGRVRRPRRRSARTSSQIVLQRAPGRPRAPHDRTTAFTAVVLADARRRTARSLTRLDSARLLARLAHRAWSAADAGGSASFSDGGTLAADAA